MGETGTASDEFLHLLNRDEFRAFHLMGYRLKQFTGILEYSGTMFLQVKNDPVEENPQLCLPLLYRPGFCIRPVIGNEDFNLIRRYLSDIPFLEFSFEYRKKIPEIIGFPMVADCSPELLGSCALGFDSSFIQL